MEAARREYKLPPQGDSYDNRSGAETKRECEPEPNVLSKAEFVAAIKRLKINKAPGPDSIPAEVWKKSAKASEYLYLFLKKVRKKYISFLTYFSIFFIKRPIIFI